MDKILVLMSTYNGEKYLVEQIESLLNQENIDVSILVRDDGSSDGTINILKSYQSRGLLKFYVGENLKSARSFFELLLIAPRSDYYAFCDQDDVWYKDKLYVGVECLAKMRAPALYYCAMDVVDENLKCYDYYFRKSEYGKSLIYSCMFGSEIAGCTMIFNWELMEKIREYTPAFLTMHDSWIHRVCLVNGGYVVADEMSHIQYRQHANNVLGMKKTNIKERMEQVKLHKNVLSKLAEELYIGYVSIDENKKKFLEVLANPKLLTHKVKIVQYAFKNGASIKELFKLTIKLLINFF